MHYRCMYTSPTWLACCYLSAKAGGHYFFGVLEVEVTIQEGVQRASKVQPDGRQTPVTSVDLL